LGSRATANQTLINALPGLFEQHAIKTVLDAPCGDFNWMSRVDLSGVSYTGADIVAELIEDNLVKHARPGVSFCLLNLLADPIPQSDLIICKDLMIHLSNVQVTQLIANIRSSGSRFLLATTCLASHHQNVDIPTGYFRRINLTLPPFNLPMPLCRTPSDRPEWNDLNALWELNRL